MALVDDYRNLLVRLQHPVYRKDFSGIVNADTSFHIIFLHLVALQLTKIKIKIDSLEANSHPTTLNIDGISRWETDYFGFSKPNKPLAQRIDELLIWINGRIGMSLLDVKKAAISITGQEPLVIVKVNKGSWVLGKAALGVNTILAGEDTLANRYTYLVKFSEYIDSGSLSRLDSELTRIEKAGSKHIISSPAIRWILGTSALGVDTILRD